MKHPEKKTLKQLLFSEKLQLKDILKIASSLTDTLIKLHRQNQIHGDINPSNIVWDTLTSKIEIEGIELENSIDFKKKAPIIFPRGTLAYMSPEQTGRTDRAVDYRTDFYSLGITLYEMLLGNPPFKSSDPGRVIYEHIAKIPDPPSSNKNIPPVISKIVMKLLEKNPEDRYRSAQGIKNDLQKCIISFDEKNEIPEFNIGLDDIPEKLNMPGRIYGRGLEIDTIRATLERTVRGSSEIIMVSGHSGIGKTSTIHEALAGISLRGSFITEGKFDPMKRDIPYSGVIQAFSHMINRLLTESPEKLTLWKNRLLEALGKNGNIIIDVIPEVELIVGPQPALHGLGPSESKKLFDVIFQKFFKVFAHKEHPLIMFLDDLQFADTATMQLIETSFIETGIDHFLLIGSYRDEEVNDNHPLKKTIERLTQQNVIMTSLCLPPLEVDDVNEMLTDIFSSGKNITASLSDTIMNKTRGNSFYIREFIKRIHREKLIRFNPDNLQWEWEIEGINSMAVSDNVADLLDRLKNLNSGQKDMLRVASCAGSIFSPSTIAEATGLPYEETIEAVNSSVMDGLLLPVTGNANRENKTIHFKFVHDKIQEAAYSLLSPEEVTLVHFKLGKALIMNANEETIEENIFEIVHHLVKSSRMPRSEKEKKEFAILSLKAGKKAKASAAYEQAVSFLSSGINILPSDSWKENYGLTRSMHMELAECEYLSSNFSRAEELFKTILSHSSTVLEKADVFRLRMVLYQTQSLHHEAVRLGIDALRLMGLYWPIRPSWDDINHEIEEFKKLMSGRDPEKLYDLPEMADPEQMCTVGLLMIMMSPSYFTDKKLMALVIVKIVNLSLVHGNCSFSPFGYMTHAMIIGSVLDDFDTGFRLALTAFKLAEKYNDGFQNGMVYHFFAFLVCHWKKHMKNDLEFFNSSIKYSIESGNLLSSCWASANHLITQYVKGDHLDSIVENTIKCYDFIRNLKYKEIAIEILPTRQAALCLQGKTRSHYSFSDELFDEEKLAEDIKSYTNKMLLVWYSVTKMQVLFIFGNFFEALRYAKGSEVITDEEAIGSLRHSEHYFYSCLTATALYETSSQDEKKSTMGTLFRKQKKMKLWADNSPENFLHKYFLIEAEIARITGKKHEAMELFDKSIKTAAENEFAQDEAIAWELAGNFYLSQGREKIAMGYMQEAIEKYDKWGASAKVSDLRKKINNISKISFGAKEIKEKIKWEPTVETRIDAGFTDLIDLTSIMMASQAISSEIIFDKMINKLMKILIENAGAQAGFLVIDKDPAIIVEAAEDKERGILVILRSLNDTSEKEYPQSIINYVKRTGNDIILNDAAGENLFSADPYISKQAPNSMLCMPLVEQSKITGILYLENRILKSVFTKERVSVIKILASQAAISIKNSLYHEEINRTKEERIKAEQEILRISENERQEIGQDLHDDLAPHLIAIDVLVKALINRSNKFGPENKSKLEKIRGLIFDAISKTKRLARGLCPVHLVEKGLENSLLDLAKSTHEIYGINCELNSNGGCSEDIDTSTQLFYLAREAVHNAVKHGQADKIVITLNSDETGLSLTVSDNGRGLVKNFFHDGMGINIMKHRANLLGAYFEIKSALGEGTSVNIHLPATRNKKI